MTLILWALFALIIAGATAAGLRARDAMDTAIGHDSKALTDAWSHRRRVRNMQRAVRGNHRRMG